MTSIYCIGRNYINHAKELGNEVPSTPVVFTKTINSLRGFQSKPIAFENEIFHFEGELVLRIGKNHNLYELSSEQSIDAIAFGIDLTRRNEQQKLKEKGLPWVTCKSFLGSAIIGKFYSIDMFNDLENLSFQFFLNDTLRQSGNTKDMLFDFKMIINYLNTFSPLQKGDLIMTGTPEGVGEIVVGDKFSFKFPELEIIENGTL